MPAVQDRPGPAPVRCMAGATGDRITNLHPERCTVIAKPPEIDPQRINHALAPSSVTT